MTKTNLQVVGALPPGPEPPASTPLTPAREALRDAIGQRAAMKDGVDELERQLRKLDTPIAAEKKAAAAVSAIEASLEDRMAEWVRAGQDPPALADGADLPEAYELLRKTQPEAAAARALQPRWVAELEAALDRRGRLEETIKQLVVGVLAEEADAIAARVRELEGEAARETARLASLRRPFLRLMGQDVMGGRRAVNTTVDLLLADRRYFEAEVRAMEPMFAKRS
jgi:hypothetical protein